MKFETWLGIGAVTFIVGVAVGITFLVIHAIHQPPVPLLTYEGRVSGYEENTLYEFGTNSCVYIGGRKVDVYPLPTLKIGATYKLVLQGKTPVSIELLGP